MKYFIKNNNNKNTLLLFHGTGGDHNDLVPIANIIDKNANLIAFDGNELEGGSRRFFRRFGIGNYDIKNLEANTFELKEDIKNIKNDPMFSHTTLIGLGFSNGANILESLIQLHKDTLKNYILLSPVYLRKDLGFSNLEGINILIVASYNDPYTTNEDSLSLIEDLKKAGANVETYLHELGHRVTQESLNFVKHWFESNFK